MAELEEAAAVEQQQPHAAEQASDQENADPAAGASLRKLFAEGQAQIATSRRDGRHCGCSS